MSPIALGVAAPEVGVGVAAVSAGAALPGAGAVALEVALDGSFALGGSGAPGAVAGFLPGAVEAAPAGATPLRMLQETFR
jgi:hypothetical protein